MSADTSQELPTTDDSERQVLAALLSGQLSPEVVAEITTTLQPAAFHRSLHRDAYATILDLLARGEPLDVHLVVDAMRQRGLLNGSRDPMQIRDIGAELLIAANAPTHAHRVADAADRRRVMQVGQEIVEAAASGRDWRQAATLLAAAPATASDPRTISGLDWIDDVPAGIPSVWGSGETVAWARGEPLLIVGPTGVGKTTLAQRLVRALVGLDGGSVLGYAVPPSDRPVLYVAADRPMQAQRSFRRMFAGADDVEPLAERLVVHRGPLARTLTEDPAWLAGWAERLGVGTILLDSLKDVATDIGKDEGGNRINLAYQHVVAAGMDLAVLHHQRKARQEGDKKHKPRTIDDVYGSAFITAGAGSVVLLWGEPGDPVVELEHLKQPASAIGPMQVAIDHEAGAVAVVKGTDPLGILRDAPNGMQVAEMAQRLFGGSEPNQVEKVRRRLVALVARHLAIERRGGPREPSRYYATTREREPKLAMGNSNSGRSR